MILLILIFFISLIPVLVLYWWLRNRMKDDAAYKKLCSRALRSGLLCVFPVMLCSGVIHIILRLSGVEAASPLLYKALHTFLVLAFSEEAMKYLMFRRTLKKSDYKVSWLDVTALMAIVGIGFDLLESLIYAVGESVQVILIRGICVPHVGYGFLIGYLYGKSKKTGKPVFKWIGFAFAWLIHGMYDFSLSDEFQALNDNLVFVPLLLAFFEIVLTILLVRFIRKRKNQDTYTAPLPIEGN